MATLWREGISLRASRKYVRCAYNEALLSLCEHAGDDVDIDGDDDDDDDIDGDDDGGHNVSALVIVRARGRAAH